MSLWYHLLNLKICDYFVPQQCFLEQQPPPISVRRIQNKTNPNAGRFASDKNESCGDSVVVLGLVNVMWVVFVVSGGGFGVVFRQETFNRNSSYF